MALIDKETIYSEIEARREHMVYELYGLEENTPEYQRVKGMHDAYVDMLTYLTYSLPEQPKLPGIDEEGIPGRDFIPVEWVDACERYGKWKIVSAEQPVEGLEEEVKRYWNEHALDYRIGRVADIDFLHLTARHFAEWGKNNLK